MADETAYEWDKLSKTTVGTNTSHLIVVKRESIPIIFVPGIMGTRLRTSKEKTVVWDPDVPIELPEEGGFWAKAGAVWSQKGTLWAHREQLKFVRRLAGKGALYRRRLLIGDDGVAFDDGFLEPLDAPGDTDGKGDGTQALLKKSYGPILQQLRNATNYGKLTNAFEFPVYGFGYNWTDCCRNGGKKLSERIDKILKEEKAQGKRCEHVILVSHSMGGLVSRAASKHRSHGDILGIIHGVQPVTGSPVAYWRMKGGFEEGGFVSKLLGKDGREVTVIMGNSPGGLELLPSGDYPPNWLKLTRSDGDRRTMPSGDPYDTVYKEKEMYWRVVDPDLLDPSRVGGDAPPLDPDEPEADAAFVREPWQEYERQLRKAKEFHAWLGSGCDSCHPETYALHGAKLPTSATVTMFEDPCENPYGRGDSRRYMRKDNYVVRGFNSFSKTEEGEEVWALLRDPEGFGDGTVPEVSGTKLDGCAKHPPAPLGIEKGGHEPIYKDRRAQQFVFSAIADLCLKHKLDKV